MEKQITMKTTITIGTKHKHTVGTRVAGMHTQLGEEEAQEHTTQSSIT